MGLKMDDMENFGEFDDEDEESFEKEIDGFELDD